VSDNDHFGNREEMIARYQAVCAELDKVTKERDETQGQLVATKDARADEQRELMRFRYAADQAIQEREAMAKDLEIQHAVSAELGAQAEDMATERDAALAKLEETNSILSSVAATSVQQLRDRYLASMKRENEKDKPDGFDSWEAYHKRVIDLRAQLAAARDALAPFAALPVEQFLQHQKHPDSPVIALNGVAITATHVMTARAAIDSAKEGK